MIDEEMARAKFESLVNSQKCLQQQLYPAIGDLFLKYISFILYAIIHIVSTHTSKTACDPAFSSHCGHYI